MELKLMTYKKEYMNKSGEVKTATNFVLECGKCKVLIKPSFDKDFAKLLTIANILNDSEGVN